MSAVSYDVYTDIEQGSMSYVDPGPCAGATFTVTASIPELATSSYVPFKEVVTKSGPSNGGSFSQIKKSGQIKMTNYSVSSVKTTNYLLTLKEYDYKFHWPACGERWDGVNNVYMDLWYGPQLNVRSSWNHVMNTDEWLTRYPSASKLLADEDALSTEIESARNACMGSVVSQAYTTLDLLTTAAEAKETLTTIGSLLESARKPLQTLHGLLRAAKSPTEASDLWLKYRYGISPIIYTIQDVIEVAKKRGYIFDSYSSSQTIDLAWSPLTLPTHCYYQNRTGSVNIRASGRARFSSGKLHSLDSTTFNPALTAWELISYSFVVGWFINVSDWISAKSFEIADVADQRLFCVSVKRDESSTFTAKGKNEFSYSKTIVDDRWARDGTYTQSDTVHYESILRKIQTSSYSRVLFQPSDVKLQFRPEMTNLRWVDALALTTQSLSKFLRKLK